MTTLPLAPAFAADDLMHLSALEQARLIRERKITSTELVQRYLERIEAHNAQLQAFVSVFEREALRAAKRADRAVLAGAALGPFHGVPTAMKDHHMMRNTRTQLGSRAFRWLWSPVDDSVVRRMRAAGFVLLGKTAMSELGMLPITETALQPPTRNPWNLNHTAGGSSGGAGAAIAAGLLPIAPGSDGAGSVRIPASLNGLIGHKPTRGLVPDDAARIDPFGMVSIGPLARSIDDAAALLDVLAAPGMQHHLERSKQPVRRLKIGIIMSPPHGALDPRIEALVRRVAIALERAGHQLVELDRPRGNIEEFIPIYQKLISRIPVIGRGQLQPVVRWFWEAGRTVTEDDARRRFLHFEALGIEMMSAVDVILSPTVGVLPFRVGEFASLPPAELFHAVAPLGAFTVIANLSGQPALTIPCGEVDGLPVGVQLGGRRHEDAFLLALAREVQSLLQGGGTPDAIA